MGKIKISTKLVFTYFILILTVFVVTIISFHFLSQKYIINETKQELRDEGQLIAKTLRGMTLTNESIQ
jgi:hypothetical protein